MSEAQERSQFEERRTGESRRMRQNGTKKARIVKVIETETMLGEGTHEDPVRFRHQYWSFDGKLLGCSEFFEAHPDAIDY